MSDYLSEAVAAVPEHCPGIGSEKAGLEFACAGCPNQKLCASGEAAKPDPAIEKIKDRLSVSLLRSSTCPCRSQDFGVHVRAIATGGWNVPGEAAWPDRTFERIDLQRMQ